MTAPPARMAVLPLPVGSQAMPMRGEKFLRSGWSNSADLFAHLFESDGGAEVADQAVALCRRREHSIPVHAGHQVWEQLGLSEILQAAGLPERAVN